jgi:hypothetical protein
MPTTIAVISLVVGAVGAGVQYSSAQSAAKSQESLALLNAQSQRQAIDQTGQVNAMQAAINGALARKDQAAAEANAKATASQAELMTRQSVEATRRSREEAGRFAAQQVASLAKGGFADTTGSPLALLADTAEKSQQEADRLRFEDEQNRRSMFREVSITRNQGVLAGLNVTGQRLSGLAAAQQATQQQAQARLDYYGQRATASAARATATGNLINQAGGLAYQGYGMYRNAPRGKSTT